MKHENNLAKRALRFANIFLLLLVPLALLPILGGWIGDIAKDWIAGQAPVSQSSLWLLGGSSFLLLVLAGLVVSKGRMLLPPNVLVQSPEFEPRRVMIALLSPCRNLRETADGQWEVQDERTTGKPWVSLAGKTLEDIIGKQSNLPQWTWQQTLRGAAYHRASLQKLVLVGSSGPGGSGAGDQLDLCKGFLSCWFRGKVIICGEPQRAGDGYDTRWQADFEDLSGMTHLLRNILRKLRRDEPGLTDSDLVIDCTGGFKVASIAAAMVTLDRPKLMFQYVGTGAHAGDVIGFDVTTEHYSD